MARLPQSARGKRTRFFPAEGVDELQSMVLELMAELWVVKERLHLVEKAADEAGLDLSARIERLELTTDEKAGREAERKRLISNVMRTLEAEHEDRATSQAAIDEAD